MAKKRSLTKTSQLFQGESSYKLFKRVAINFLVETKLCKAVQQDSPRSLIEKYFNSSETLTGVTQSKIGDVYLLASERSERDTYRGNTIENRGGL